MWLLTDMASCYISYVEPLLMLILLRKGCVDVHNSLAVVQMSEWNAFELLDITCVSEATIQSILKIV